MSMTKFSEECRDEEAIITRKHRVAVVGCGALAQIVHLPHIQRNPRMHLVATCDIDPDTAKTCRDTYGAERYETEWSEVVKADDIDMIVLATHTNLRGALITAALRAGKPVYTEKPVSASREELLDIVRVARKTGVPVCVGHNRRSSPAIIEFKRLLDKAKTAVEATRPSIDRHADLNSRLPEEYQLQLLMRVNDDARSWKPWVFWDEEGIMFAEMVHFIDLALWFNDGYPVRVFAEGSCRGNFALIIKFSDGSISNLHHTMVGNFDYPKELFEVSVNNISIAMDQHIEVRQVGMVDEPVLQTYPYAEGCNWADEEGITGYMHSLDRERRRAMEAGEAPRFLNVYKGHYDHLERFLDHIEGKGENPCSVESAFAVNRIAAKLLESANSGMPVVIGPAEWHLPGV